MDDFAALQDNGSSGLHHQQHSEPTAPKRRKRRTPISEHSLVAAPNVVAPPSSGGSWLNHEPQLAASQNDLDESEKSMLVSRIVATIKEQTKILESGGTGTQQNSVPASHFDGTNSSVGNGVVSVIDVPANWHRQLVENSVIVYISPSGQILTSLEQVRTYLTNPDVCKCGLTCPFRVEDVFNFDADVATSSFSTGSYHHQSWSMGNCYSALPHDPNLLQSQQPTAPVVKRARGRPRKRKTDSQPTAPIPSSSSQNPQFELLSEKPAVCVNVNALDPNSFIRPPTRQMKNQQTEIAPPPDPQQDHSDNAVAFVIDSSSIASPSQSNLYVRLPPELLAAFLSQQNTSVIGVNATNQQDGVQQHCFLVPIQALGATISTTPVTIAQTSPNTETNNNHQQQQQQPTTPPTANNRPTQKPWQNDEMVVVGSSSTATTRKLNASQGSACSVQSAASSGYHSANNTPVNDKPAVSNNQPNSGLDHLNNSYDYYLNHNHNNATTNSQPPPPPITVSSSSQQNQFYFDSDFYQDEQYRANQTTQSSSLLMDMDFFNNTPYNNQLVDNNNSNQQQLLLPQPESEFFANSGSHHLVDLYDHPGIDRNSNTAANAGTNDIEALFGSDCCDYSSVFSNNNNHYNNNNSETSITNNHPHHLPHHHHHHHHQQRNNDERCESGNPSSASNKLATDSGVQQQQQLHE